MQQTTIQETISFSGIGVHSGKNVKVTLSPGKKNSGIIFKVPVQNKTVLIHPSPNSVITTVLATTLGKDGVTIATVEHLLAAIRGLNIDNISIHVEGGEIPIMDGSAKTFTKKLLQAEIKQLQAPRKILQLTRPFELVSEEKYIRATPYDGLKIDYTINFPHPLIGTQRLSLDITPQTFSSIAKARTFGFLKDVEYLQKKGLALGGSLDNAVVLDTTNIINPEGLRYPDEFVRHKILDFIGDIAMMPLPLHGHFEIYCSGHQLNNQFLLALQNKNILVALPYTNETPIRHIPSTYPNLKKIAAV